MTLTEIRLRSQVKPHAPNSGGNGSPTRVLVTIRNWGAVGTRIARYATALGLALLLAACATAPNTTDDGSTVKAESGWAGCRDCAQIRTFISKTLASQLYVVKDANNAPTGQRISASLQLGLSNRQAGLVGGLSAGAGAIGYLSTITGPQAHFFIGEVPTDGNHPYRFLIRLHHNSSFVGQEVQLVEEEKFQSLPAMHLEGTDSGKSCFSSGCVWDADYVISAKIVYRHIELNSPLTVFVGNHPPRQVKSQDGLNVTYEVVNSGVFLRVSADQLRNFVNSVHLELTER